MNEKLARITRIVALDPPEGAITVQFALYPEGAHEPLVLVETVDRRNPSLANISDIARSQAADRLERIAAYLRDVDNWRSQSSGLPST